MKFFVEWNSSRDEFEEEGECEDPLILAVLSETLPEVAVESESRNSQFLTIRDEECGHTK